MNSLESTNTTGVVELTTKKQRLLKTLQKVDKNGIDVAKFWLGFLISWKTQKSTRTSFNLTFWFTEPDVIFFWQQGFDNTYCWWKKSCTSWYGKYH